jgi:lipoate-protein ligase A
LSQALLRAIKLLGVEAQALPTRKTNHQEPGMNDPVCFEVPSNYEITVRGKKLIGSAQARKKNGILQHGTLPLHGDLTRILEVLNYRKNQNEEKEKLLQRASTLQSVRGTRINWDEAASAFIKAFKENLNLKFEEINPSQAELDRTEILIKEKYAHPVWTERI